ncbi:MAG TPA: flagellar biosynthesis protein FlhF [Steroidobacteraceae bacterium]|nr:flagellar biosynthesis protein FlhF [Steroidobacteraceae bacterium]
MKIRRYLAKDMRQALNQVREAQGPDAVILSSRRSEEGVEIVAAVDFEELPSEQAQEATYGERAYRDVKSLPEMPAPRRTESSNDFSRNMQTLLQNSSSSTTNIEDTVADDSSNLSNELHALRRMLETQVATLAWNDLTRRAPLQTTLLKQLAQYGISQPLAVEVVSQIPARMEWHEAQRMMLALVAKKIHTHEERWLDRGGMVAFVGPTGVGKSTLVAKLAARWVLQHGSSDIVLISADAVRIGAHDQMQNLGRLLGVPAYTIDQINELGSLLSSVEQRRLVLVDTAGFSQRDARLAAELALLATSHRKLETALVISACAQAGAVEETILRFSAAAPKSCVLTKIDEATSLGGSISALVRHGVPLAYVSEGQRIPEDLAPARAHQLVARAVELSKRSGAQADDEVLSLKFGGVAHALA